MNEDEMMQMIEQVAARTDHQRTRKEKEAYINNVVSSLSLNAWNTLAGQTGSIPEPTRAFLEQWQKGNRDRVSFQIGELIRMLLRRELLGE